MDEIRCEIRIAQEADKPARLVGVLMPYNTEARDRRELFEAGSLTWDPKGIVVNRMHQRSSPIMRVVPIEAAGKLTINSEIPDTAAGRDCVSEVRSGLLASLSVEFKSIKEDFVGGCRRITSALLTGAAVCDEGAYEAATVEATVEARARAEAVRRASDHVREFLL